MQSLITDPLATWPLSLVPWSLLPDRGIFLNRVIEFVTACYISLCMLSRMRKPRGRPSNAPDALSANRRQAAPNGTRWAHELKHDGYRLQIHVRDGASYLAIGRKPANLVGLMPWRITRTRSNSNA